jgi:CheY-like chemotaxis protein
MNRILLVEDNPINQKVALRLLVLLGYDADLAENGEEAVLLLEQRHEDYAAVLMDIQMPVMDGLAATRAIRGLAGEASRIPIIALTANASQRDRQNCLAAGMNDFLAKPINKDLFAAALEHWTAAQLTA